MSESIVRDLFIIRTNSISSDIVKNAEAILIECAELFDIIENAHNIARMAKKDENAKAGTDAIRDALLVMHGPYAWLYDSIGKPTGKKGICKPIMTTRMRKIREGMLFLADENNAEKFRTWAASKDAKSSGVVDFANIKTAIEPKAAPAPKTAPAPKAPAPAGEGEGDAIETPTKRTKAEFLAWVYNQAKTEFGMDSLDFAEFIESKEGQKIADDFIEAA